jgi:hypothetical protein
VYNLIGGKMAREITRTAQDRARQNRQKQTVFRNRRKAEGFTEFKRWIKPLDNPPVEIQNAANALLQSLKTHYADELAWRKEPFQEDINALKAMLEGIRLVNNLAVEN